MAERHIDPSTKPVERAPLDIDKALDDAAFRKFLAGYEDADTLDMSDEAAISERYDTYEVYQSVNKDVNGLYTKQIEQELNLKLGKEGTAAIETHLMKEIRENPEAVKDLKVKLDTFAAQQKKLAELQTRFKSFPTRPQLEAAIGGAKSELTHLQTIKNAGLMGRLMYRWFNVGDKQDAAYQALSGKYGKDIRKGSIASAEFTKQKKHLERLGDQDKDAMAAGRALEAQEKSLEETRRALVGSLLEQEQIAQAVQKSAQDKLKQMLEKGKKGYIDIAAAEDEYQHLVTVAESFGDDTEFKPEEFRDAFDKMIEERAKKEVRTAIEKVKSGNGEYSKLEKSLAAFMSINRLGSKEGDEALQFIVDTVEEQVAKIGGDKEEDKMKRLMLRRLVAKMQNPVTF